MRLNQFKNTFIGFILGIMIMIFFFPIVLGSNELKSILVNFTVVKKIIIDGVEKFPPEDMKPFVYNGRTYVSLRYIGEVIGRKVDWDSPSGTITISRADENTIDIKAKELLAKYNYHILRKKAFGKMYLSQGLTRQYNASTDIGLNLKKYIGKEVNKSVYELKERSQAEGYGEVYAVICYNDNNEIIGAYLSYRGYAPGVVSVKHRSSLKPESLDPSELNFIKINKAEILGPWDESSQNKWTNKKVIESDQLDKFLSLLNTSKSHNERLKDNLLNQKKKYMVVLCYKDGPKVTLRFYTDLKKFTIDNISNWYFDASEELISYITSG